MNNMELARMWINQPSTLQPLHKMNGVNVLACPKRKGLATRRVYFLRGDIISQEVPSVILSEGWNKEMPIRAKLK